MSRPEGKSRAIVDRRDTGGQFRRSTRATTTRIKEEVIDEEFPEWPVPGHAEIGNQTAQPNSLRSDPAEPVPAGTDQLGHVETAEQTVQPLSLHSDRAEPVPAETDQPAHVETAEQIVQPPSLHCDQEVALPSKQSLTATSGVPVTQSGKALADQPDPVDTSECTSQPINQHLDHKEPLEGRLCMKAGSNAQCKKTPTDQHDILLGTSAVGTKGSQGSRRVQGEVKLESQFEYDATSEDIDAEDLVPISKLIKKKDRQKHPIVTGDEERADACRAANMRGAVEQQLQMKDCSVLLTQLKTLPRLHHTPPQSPARPAKVAAPRSPIIFNPYVEESVKHRVALYEDLQQPPEPAVPMWVTRTKTRALAAAAAATLTKAQTIETLRSKKIRASDARERLENKSRDDTSSKDTTINSNYNLVTHLTTFLKPPSKQKVVPDRQLRLLRQAQEEEARLKKEERIQAKIRELKRQQREERRQRVMNKKVALDKDVQEQVLRQQREKEERMQQLQRERDEKQREDAMRKKQVAQQKALEMEDRRKQEETARLAKLREQEEEQNRLQASRKKEQEEAEKQIQKRLAEEREAAAAREQIQKKTSKHAKDGVSKVTPPAPQANEAKMPVLEEAGHESILNQTYQVPSKEVESYKMLDSEESSDDEANPRMVIPKWALCENIQLNLRPQEFVSSKLWSQFMSCYKQTPDLAAMFGQKELRWLNRKSSAVWRTPPRLEPRE